MSHEDASAQRPPSEVLHAHELARLQAHDAGQPKPPGWALSPKAVRAFIMGDAARGVRKKFVGHPSLVDRAMVALATSRGLMLIGEPGTAKSLLSELLAAAISGTSLLTVQGSAGTDGTPLQSLSSPMSTAEAVAVAHALGVRAHFLGDQAATPGDLVECLLGAALTTERDDAALLRRYFEQRVARRPEPHWQAYYEARHRLPG